METQAEGTCGRIGHGKDPGYVLVLFSSSSFFL
jgi:hypothetical protein